MTSAERSRRWYEAKQAATGGLFSTLCAMKTRCYQKKSDNYAWYGGRGITVCQEWLDNPESFYHWARTAGFRRGLQIDRVDNSKGYSPDNCRFVTPIENQNNKRPRTRTIGTYTKVTVAQVFEIRKLISEGVPQTELARQFKVDRKTIWNIQARRTWKEII